MHIKGFSDVQIKEMITAKSLEAKPGMPFSFPATSHIDTIITFFALLKNGAIPFPQNYRFPQIDITTRGNSDIYLQTSGSSTEPKIAALSLRNFFSHAEGILPSIHLESSDRYLLSLPLHHVAGLSILFRCLASNATLVLPKKDLHKQIIEERITHLSLVPTQLYRLLQHKSHYPTLKAVLVGGAPISSDLIQKASHLPLLQSYGMTEMTSTIALNGKILPHVEVTIAKDQEILVKGKSLFQGYLHGNPPKGWFPTGDLGKFTKNGLEILGRKDRLFICGGENIYPETIEKVLFQIPGITEAHVTPIPDPEYGARPIAYIQSQLDWSESQLLAQLKELLPSLFLPIRILPLKKIFIQGDAD